MYCGTPPPTRAEIYIRHEACHSLTSRCHSLFTLNSPNHVRIMPASSVQSNRQQKQSDHASRSPVPSVPPAPPVPLICISCDESALPAYTDQRRLSSSDDTYLTPTKEALFRKRSERVLIDDLNTDATKVKFLRSESTGSYLPLNTALQRTWVIKPPSDFAPEFEGPSASHAWLDFALLEVDPENAEAGTARASSFWARYPQSTATLANTEQTYRKKTSMTELPGGTFMLIKDTMAAMKMSKFPIELSGINVNPKEEFSTFSCDLRDIGFRSGHGRSTRCPSLFGYLHRDAEEGKDGSNALATFVIPKLD